MEIEGPRPPRLDERDDLIRILNYVMREEVGHAPTFHLDWPHVIDPANLPNLRVIKSDGKIVSSTGIWPHSTLIGDVRLVIGGINGVCTDPAYRRNRFATTILHSIIARLTELGSHVSLLSTGVPSWYRKLGWEHGGTKRSYRFDRGNRHLVPADAAVRVRLAHDADFQTLAALHNGRRFGAQRTAEHMRVSFGRHGRSTWVAERRGRVEGYVWGAVEDLREYGGLPEAVLPMLRQLYDDADDPAVKTSTQTVDERQARKPPTLHAAFAAPDYPDPVTRALDEIGILHARSYLDMIRLDDPAGLVAAYAATGLRATDYGDTIAFECGTERIRLSRTDSVKLLFGPERPAPFARDVLPLTFHEWSADMA